jgi:hypothetical protein
MIKSRLSLVLGVVIICLFLSGQVLAVDWNWRAYETENFVVFYPKGYQRTAEKTSSYLEAHRDEILELTGNDRDLKAHIVIQDL